MDERSIAFGHRWFDLARVGVGCSFRPPVGHAVSVLDSGLQTDVYLLPEELGEKVAKLHFLALNVEFTVRTQEQAERAC